MNGLDTDQKAREIAIQERAESLVEAGMPAWQAVYHAVKQIDEERQFQMIDLTIEKIVKGVICQNEQNKAP